MGKTYIIPAEIKIDKDETKLKAFGIRIKTVQFNDNDGTQYLDDIRFIEKAFGIDETFSAH